MVLNADAGEDWSFATKLTDLSESFDDNNENGYPDLEIFQVKFLGSAKIDAAKSEEATSSAIKSIISTAKGECSISYQMTQINIFNIFIFFLHCSVG